MNKICSKCNIEKKLSNFHTDKKKKDGVSPWCKLCRKIYYTGNKNILLRVSDWQKNNRKDIKEIVFQYYTNNDIKCQQCGETDIDCLTVDHIKGGGCKHIRDNKISNLYQWIIANNYPNDFQILCWNCQSIKRLMNKESQKENCKSSLKELVNARKYSQSIRKHTIQQYGCKCNRCGYSDWRALEFDHIKDNGKEHRETIGHNIEQWLKRFNYPNLDSVNLQLFCVNCHRKDHKNSNRIKGGRKKVY